MGVVSVRRACQHFANWSRPALVCPVSMETVRIATGDRSALSCLQYAMCFSDRTLPVG
jgi:hypothetical protein